MFAVVAVERIAEGEEETEAQKADKHSARRDATAPQRKEGGKGFTREKGPLSFLPLYFLSFFPQLGNDCFSFPSHRNPT